MPSSAKPHALNGSPSPGRVADAAGARAGGKVGARAGAKAGTEKWSLIIGFAGLAFFPLMAVAISVLGPEDTPPIREFRTRTIPISPAAPPAAGNDRQESGAVLPEAAAPRLRGERLDVLQTFSTNPSRDLCLQLSVLGFANEGWSTSAFSDGAWECVSATLDPEAGEEEESGADGESKAPANTLFFVLRGGLSTRIDSVFVKINIHDPARKHDMLARTEALLASVGFAFGSPLPSQLMEAIRSSKDREGSVAEVRFKVDREFGAVERYNLRLWRRAPPALAQTADLSTGPLSPTR